LQKYYYFSVFFNPPLAVTVTTVAYYTAKSWPVEL